VEVDAALLAHAEELAEQEALRGYDAVHLAGSLFVGVDVLVTADAALIDAGLRWAGRAGSGGQVPGP
jgi:uncharacterized protein